VTAEAPPIRILVVDDSAVFRMVLARVLGRTPGFIVVGNAASGHDALDAARRLTPDVVTLDIEMPGLNGLETLSRLLAERPTRVMMVSRATHSGAQVTLDAMRLGAIDAIAKPDGAWGSGEHPFVDELVAKIRAVALVPLARVGPFAAAVAVGALQAPPAPRVPRPARSPASRGLVVIATSTGGPRALDALLGRLEAPLGAGVLVVQHMLTGFTTALAHRLDKVGALRVGEARTGDLLTDGHVLVAPGDSHIVVERSGRVRLVTSAPIVGLRPAADVTLLAAAEAWGPRLLVVVLTGMGRDGTAGAAAAKARGGIVIAQDEATSALYGMPRAIAEAGLADRILPLGDIAEAISDWARALPDDGLPKPGPATDTSVMSTLQRAEHKR
jgi:two-component system chemotaxis response regulator CheB